MSVPKSLRSKLDRQTTSQMEREAIRSEREVFVAGFASTIDRIKEIGGGTSRKLDGDFIGIETTLVTPPRHFQYEDLHVGVHFEFTTRRESLFKAARPRGISAKFTFLPTIGSPVEEGMYVTPNGHIRGFRPHEYDVPLGHNLEGVEPFSALGALNEIIDFYLNKDATDFTALSLYRESLD